MIIFKNIDKSKPFKILKEKYDEAIEKNQSSIEAMSISSFSTKQKEVNSRYVNLKFIDGNNFIFFSNYDSPKAFEFAEHNQISALLLWDKLNLQIRIKALIEKKDINFNKEYFVTRNLNKNALAISSQQSKRIDSYDEVKNKYLFSIENDNLKECPNYWGGFSFSPYSIEFWEGHKSRINKRDLFYFKENNWVHTILQP